MWSDDRISRDRKIDLIEAWLEGKFELTTSGDGSMTPILSAAGHPPGLLKISLLGHHPKTPLILPIRRHRLI